MNSTPRSALRTRSITEHLPIARDWTDTQVFTPESQTLNVLNAHDYAAKALNKPLNTYIVISLPVSRGWVPGRRTTEQYRSVRERYFEALRNWCKRNGIPALWVYADENPPQGGHGPHLNILMHLPEENWAELRSKLFHCLRKCAGASRVECPDGLRPDLQRKAIHVLPEASRGPMDTANSERVLLYMLKGADPDLIVLNQNNMPVRLGDLPGIQLSRQGDVSSDKRAGASLLLSKATRKGKCWIDAADLTWLIPTTKIAQKDASVILPNAPADELGALPGGAGDSEASTCALIAGIASHDASNSLPENAGDWYW